MMSGGKQRCNLRWAEFLAGFQDVGYSMIFMGSGYNLHMISTHDF
jgi:hypothetical protein